ncbi:cation diffusion facilitator family transporter [Frigidibacter oleivorans]|uniref:cation diffusion facilitator family transporter n=1 Tax=Frigidibacter oleivorans TaxID=2487129 RepID=UPI000F8C8F54|nr:cation diffusion facilitator family transporter [Frigidibacter oleivorans]
MPHDHGHHGHSHAHAGAERNVALAVVVNLVLTVAQVAGGILSGSVALIADALHNFSDAVSLIVAFAARRIARRPADATMTFGYGRAEVVAALVNYTALILISLWLAYEAVLRILDPQPVAGGIVIVLAGVALVIDLITAALTWRLAQDSVNIRAAFLHNLADAGSSVAVIVGGALILMFDWRLADPIITLGISAYILWHVAQDLGPVIRILMLGAPPGMERDDLRQAIAAEEGVEGVHHLHLWQIDERRNSVEAHLVLAEGHAAPEVVARVKAMLRRDFRLAHSTFEVETRASGCAG